MSFLDKPMSELTTAELHRLISNEVARQVPAIPSGVLALDDSSRPVVTPLGGNQGQVLTFHKPGTDYVLTDPGSISDGVKPTTSPDLTAGTSQIVGDIGQIHVSWAPVSNPDPVGYDVHISGSNGFTPTAATLFGTTMSTTIGIKALADGSPLTYGTPYYIRIVCFDNDGAAAAGVQSTAAGTTLGLLIGATVETGISGKRVVMDPNGLVLYDASNGVVVNLPTDATAPATFAGTLQAATLQSAAAVLNGITQVGSGGVVTVASGVTTPISAPGLALLAGGSLTATQSYWVSYSWYDTVRETTVYTPVVKITIPPGTVRSISIALPVAPVGATQARIYMDTASFGVGAGKLQTSVAVSTTAVTALTITSFNGAGAASKATSDTGFASTTAVIRPASAVDSTGAAYGWTLEGSGKARFLGPTANAQFYLYDDFYYPSATYTPLVSGSPFGQYWAYHGAGAANNIGRANSSTTNPGILALATGTTQTGKANIGTDFAFLTGTARIRFSCLFQLVTAIPNVANSYQIVIGLSDQVTVAHTTAAMNAINIQFDNDNGTPASKLSLVCADTAGITTAAGPVADTGFHFVEFEVDAGRSAVNWWVDQVKQTPITTNIPANTAQMGVMLGIEHTVTGAGALQRNLNVDTVALFGDYVSG